MPNQLPAAQILQKENIFIMDEECASRQDIRALKIVLLNLMPIKQDTEVQLLRILGNTPLQIDLTLLRPATHESKNTSSEYLNAYYQTFEEIKQEKFDGMIITGAPVEQIPFEKVTYWQELAEIMEWTKTNVTSTFHICWGAQAGLYYHYGIQKQQLKKKKFGVFEHVKINHVPLLQGLDDKVFMPHSRHTEISREQVYACDDLILLLDSSEAGPTLMMSKNGRHIFSTGHGEYDPFTLATEYKRDLAKNVPIDMPQNYFIQNSMEKGVCVNWRSHAYILFSNWLNYYVYQVTPFNLKEIR